MTITDTHVLTTRDDVVNHPLFNTLSCLLAPTSVEALVGGPSSDPSRRTNIEDAVTDFGLLLAEYPAAEAELLDPYEDPTYPVELDEQFILFEDLDDELIAA